MNSRGSRPMAGDKGVDAKGAKEREGRKGEQEQETDGGEKKRRAMQPFDYPVRKAWSIGDDQPR